MMMDSVSQELPFSPPAETAPAASPLPFVEGELPRPKSSPLYKLSLSLVSLAMILLPALYLGIIGLCCWAVCRYAAGIEINANGGPAFVIGNVIYNAIVYVIPLSIGVAFIAFLIKPLFAPGQEADEAFPLNHADAPQLFALIGWICRSLNAPIPSRVDVNLSVNAAARFRSGIRSLFGNDLVLEFGLPLAAGLNLSQFAGVIAHEYGHFSQGAAMRAGYLIRLVNNWFYRAVYERDRWDDALRDGSERIHWAWWLRTLFYLARLGIWLARRILWLLMWTGHILSSLLSRQMEFDADIYEIRLCGSETFTANQRRLRQLDLGAAAAQKLLIQKWKQEHKLFDEIPSLIVSQAAEIPADIQARHHSARDSRPARLFDFHPSDAERIRRARAMNEPGIFHSSAPAASLFADFSELSRRITTAHYREMIGAPFKEDLLISAERPAKRVESALPIAEDGLEHYFLGVPTVLRPIFISEDKTKTVRQAGPLIAAILSNRTAMDRLMPAAQTAYTRLHEADARFLQAHQAARLLEAGFQFDPADFQLTTDELEHAIAQTAEALRAANAGMFPFEDAARTRLGDTIQLLRLCQAITLIPDARRLDDEARQWVWVLSRLETVFEPLLELRKDCAALDMLLQYRRRQPSADNLAATLENLCADIQERVNAIQQLTESTRYPFAHPAGEIFVSQYLRNTEFCPDPFELALREGNRHVEKAIALHQRLLTALVAICENVERHVLS